MLRRMIRRLLGVTSLLATMASCQAPGRERPKPAPTAASIKQATTARATSAPLGTTAPAALSATPGALPSPTGAARAPIAGATGDLCRITRGPVQLPFTGQVTLWVDENAPEPRFVFNQNGIARAVPLPAAAKAGDAKKGKDAKDGKDAKGASTAPKPPERLALSEPAERATSPACAAAGGFLFCMDRAGAIHKSATVGQEGAVIAQGRAGGSLAATAIGGSHIAYAFLGDRKTSEGATTLAFVGVDDATPTTLSEDGAGATFVTLASRGEEVLAMYIDARRVLTPVHARVLTFGGKLAVGPDAVLFVGGGTDGRLGGAIAQGTPGSEHALLALEKDHKDFGMAAIRIEEQPRDDARVTWSLYPAGAISAPVAATQGTSPIRVLRARLASADPRSKQVLELGELGADGVYKPTCSVAESASFGDLAIAVDRLGALWIAYTDLDGTWVERRGK